MTTPAVSRTEAARSHQAGLQQLQAGTARRLRGEWAQVDREAIRESWWARIPAMAAIVAAGQEAAAGRADGYLDRMTGSATAAGRVVPTAFAGWASDGRSLVSLLARPMVVALLWLARGESPDRAMAAGLASLDVIGRTQVGDAGRMADQVGITSRRTIGAYVRVVEPDACDRCVVLAGRRYEWDDAFARHPQCACTHEPAPPGTDAASPREIFDQMDRATQDKRFGADAAEAIRQGADISQIVNARRGMSAAGDRYTTEGTTRRGRAGRRLGGEFVSDGGRYRRSTRLRLAPGEIIRQSSSREEAIRMLREHGYLD